MHTNASLLLHGRSPFDPFFNNFITHQLRHPASVTAVVSNRFTEVNMKQNADIIIDE
jgi:hypothetical protein